MNLGFASGRESRCGGLGGNPYGADQLDLDEPAAGAIDWSGGGAGDVGSQDAGAVGQGGATWHGASRRTLHIRAPARTRDRDAVFVPAQNVRMGA